MPHRVKKSQRTNLGIPQENPENTISGVVSVYELTRLAIGLGLSIPNLRNKKLSDIRPCIDWVPRLSYTRIDLPM